MCFPPKIPLQRWCFPLLFIYNLGDPAQQLLAAAEREQAEQSIIRAEWQHPSTSTTLLTES